MVILCLTIKPDIITSDDNEIIESFYVKEFDWNVIIIMNILYTINLIIFLKPVFAGFGEPVGQFPGFF